VVIRWRGGEQAQPPQVSLYESAAFYAMLRQAHAFAGSALNVEGAVYLGQDRIRLFQRGNGAPRDGLQPVDATGDLAWSALWQHLQQPGSTPPSLENIVQYDLGNLTDSGSAFPTPRRWPAPSCTRLRRKPRPPRTRTEPSGDRSGRAGCGGSRLAYTHAHHGERRTVLEKMRAEH
jgi:hypothetical protein